MNCSSDLKNFENSRPSASNFKSFSRSLEQFFLTAGQNNFGNKIPFLNGSSHLRISDLTFKSTLLGCKLDTVIVIWWFQVWKCFSTLTILGKHLDDGQTEVNGHYPLALFLLLSPVHSEVIPSIMGKAETEKKSQFDFFLFLFIFALGKQFS